MENKFKTQVISDEILDKLSLKNRYSMINNILMPIFSPEQFHLFKEVQRFCLRFEKKNNITHGPNEDVYEWMGAFGKKGYLTRSRAYEVIDQNYEQHGLVADFLRFLPIDMFDTQFAFVTGANVLAVNPLYFHHDNIPVRVEALRELVTGEAVGCVAITEPERGSDAIHQLTLSEEQEDGSYILNGEKVFQTNGPKAKWAVTYATAEKNKGDKMGQFLIDTNWDGWHCERVNIPWIPKIYVGKEKLENLRVPKDYVLGATGKGRDHLFEGLVDERIGIAQIAMSECWGALVHAMIYVNIRKQFRQEILKFQGVGFLLTDLWAQTTNLTLGLIKFCEIFDRKVEKFGGAEKIPEGVKQAMVASASQLKYQACNLSKLVCYESANLMGGAGLSDNTLVQDYLGISRIQEIVGGSRQIQQYIMSMALRTLFKMSIQ
ncbi:MAG: acyl-CoA/acyl-ACP dehydrogenase [Candidatus Lokiarchaeota archaeon]|nr:acyl-CoA/acyl-ACP dehydrogenase [Candidatus Lokiarchaeota archaeon]